MKFQSLDQWRKTKSILSMTREEVQWVSRVAKLISSIGIYLLSTHYAPGTIQMLRDTTMDETDLVSVLIKKYSLVGKTDMKQMILIAVASIIQEYQSVMSKDKPGAPYSATSALDMSLFGPDLWVLFSSG